MPRACEMKRGRDVRKGRPYEETQREPRGTMEAQIGVMCLQDKGLRGSWQQQKLRKSHGTDSPPVHGPAGSPIMAS